MAIALDPKQVVSFEELLMSQVVQQEALTRLLVEKKVFTKEEFWEMVKVVSQEMKRKKKGDDINLLQCFLPWNLFFSNPAYMQTFLMEINNFCLNPYQHLSLGRTKKIIFTI